MPPTQFGGVHPTPFEKRVPRILIVEDDAGLANGLRINFEIEGYEVYAESNAASAHHSFITRRPNLVVLDLGLPDADGLELLRRWRVADPSTRVIILSGRSSESDKVAAFAVGADDYITKPFSLAELLARIKVQLARVEQIAPKQTFILGHVTVNLTNRTIERDGKTLHLAPKEAALLEALIGAQGAPVSKRHLIEHVWGFKGATPATNTVAVHIASLRKKIETHHSRPRHILTVSRVGYRLAP